MARATNRVGTKNAQFVRRIPSDLVGRLMGGRFTFKLPSAEIGGQPVVARAKAGLVFSFSLQTADPALVTMRHAAALAQVEALFKAERRGPQELSFKAIQALAGVAYRQVVEDNEENPGRAADWRIYRELVAEAGEYLDPHGDGVSSPRYDAKAAERALISIFDVDAFLSGEGVKLTPPDRAEFVGAVTLALRGASEVLEARAARDYSPDVNTSKFPEWHKPETRSSEGFITTFEVLFSRWRAETRPSPNTVTTWESRVRRFTKFVGHDDPRRVTKEDVTRWKDSLVAEGRKEINKTYLATIRALFSYAVSNASTSGLTVNPVSGVSARQKDRAGEGRLPYESDEVQAILLAARSQSLPTLRWMPWLLAQTGARVGEIAQLWGSMVIERKGLPCLHLTPSEDGGTLKNVGSERVVPLHPEIIAEGFLEFVKERGSGPLFYGANGNRAARAREDGASRHPSKGAANRVATWIRKMGFDNPRKAPNHAFRHWLKTTLIETGCSERLADAIQGHAPKSEGAKYFHGKEGAMLEALSRVRLARAE